MREGVSRGGRAVEKYYSTSETAFLLGYDAGWVRKNVALFAAYGRVAKIGEDYRFSASAINGLLEACEVRRVEDAIEAAGVFARSEGELKRKCRDLEEARNG